LGIVFFTDGTNEVTPNQQQCEVYGYKYDHETRTCRAYDYNPRIISAFNNEDNKIQGARNSVEQGTSNTYVLGQNNTIKGISRNNIIVGSNNEIANGISNVSILGRYGLAQRPGEAVIGGGGSTVGKSQSSTIHLSGITEDDTATSLSVNGMSSITTIARDADTSGTSFAAFEASVIGVRTGGSAAGSVYDRIFLRAEGLIYEKAEDQQIRTFGSYGTVTGWTAAVAFSGTNDMLFQVTGAEDMNITWSCTLNLYEMKV